MNKTRREHLMNNIPNNFITRWLVDKANKKMRDSNSYGRLQKRYRCPREGFKYDYFGGIVPNDYRKFVDGKLNQEKLPPAYKRARKFSLYLRKR